ncbi:MAG: adenosylcobinamide amidohydrolase, partial [Vulcanisaeta sp.]
GTITIRLLTNAKLTAGAMARALVTITEAKVAALQDLDVRSSYNPKVQATGTGTDNAVIISDWGPLITYTGGHSKIGELMAKTVYEAVKEAIIRSSESPDF